MSEKEKKKYKTPLRKLVNFFEQSRNQWKEKSIEAKSTIKRLSNRVRYLETTKAEWKQRAILFEKELKQYRLQTEKKTDELELKKPIIQPTTKTVPTGRFEIVPFHHQYSVDHIMLSLSFVLSFYQLLLVCVEQAVVWKPSSHIYNYHYQYHHGTQFVYGYYV